jgi:hypothetical protein
MARRELVVQQRTDDAFLRLGSSANEAEEAEEAELIFE